MMDLDSDEEDFVATDGAPAGLELDPSMLQFIDEEEEKTTEDFDLLPFFLDWTPQSRINFHARMPAMLPESLLEILGTDASPTPLMVQLILTGNWIPSYFPTSCPPDLARWLYAMICFAEDEELSASAWDAWTFYFGRGGLWDVDDAAFGWFQDNKGVRVGLEWVPDWDTLVDTLEAFGANSELYRSGSLVQNSRNVPQKRWPNRVNRVCEPPEVDADLVASFPVTWLRRFFSLTSLSVFASASGRLLDGRAVYSEQHAALLIQIALAALVDPLMSSASKREASQCVSAAVEVFPDMHRSSAVVANFIILVTPHADYSSVVSALSLFTPTTKAAQWLRRSLAICVARATLQDKLGSAAPPAMDIEAALFDARSILAALLSTMNLLEHLVVNVGKQAFPADFMLWYQTVLCFDLTLGDRNAVAGGQETIDLAKEIEGACSSLHGRFKKGGMVNEFGLALRSMLATMQDRISFNRSYETNRKEALKVLSASKAIGSTGKKQTTLSFNNPDEIPTTPTGGAKKRERLSQ